MRGVEVVERLRVEELLDRDTDDAIACVTVTGALVTLGDFVPEVDCTLGDAKLKTRISINITSMRSVVFTNLHMRN